MKLISDFRFQISDFVGGSRPGLVRRVFEPAGRASDRANVISNFAFVLPLLLLVIGLLGCASSMKQSDASKIIAGELNLPEKSVQVTTVSGMGGNLVADATLQISFALQRTPEGHWQILRVQESNGWTSPDHLKAKLQTSALSRSLSSAFLAELDNP